MNRLSFFKTLAATTAGLIVAPALFIPKEHDRYRWRKVGALDVPYSRMRFYSCDYGDGSLEKHWMEFQAPNEHLVLRYELVGGVWKYAGGYSR